MELKRSTIKTMITHAEDILNLEAGSALTNKKLIQIINNKLVYFHEEYSKETEHDNEALSGICLAIGILIGELVRVTYSVEFVWVHGSTVFGPEELPYLKSDVIELYPTDWVYKQILYGNEESIANKLENLRQQIPLL